MEAQDYVRLLYQHVFGRSHIRDSQGLVLARLQEGYGRNMLSEHNGPRIISVGNGMSRVSLFPPPCSSRTFARLVSLSSECSGDGTREDFLKGLSLMSGLVSRHGWSVAESLSAWEREYEMGRKIQGVHHSDAYKKAYRPYYCLVDESLVDYLPVFLYVENLLREWGKMPLALAIDGRCCSGKTFLAHVLEKVFPCLIIHADDYFLPPELATPERRIQPGDNIHHERLVAEVLEPFSQGRRLTLRRFDCSQQSFSQPVYVDPPSFLIVEGSYSMNAACRGYYNGSIFLSISSREQMRRLEGRETEKNLTVFRDRWIPLEEKYFSQEKIRHRCGLLVSPSGLPSATIWM